MRTIDDLKRWKDYGFVMTPVNQDKTPGLKPKQKWKYDWSDEILLSADRLGVFHDQSSVFTIDFDDDAYVAHQYLRQLPDTFTDGRFIGDHHVMTHRTYKLNGQGAPTIGGAAKYPKNISKKKGLLVEVLTGKQTIFTGGDRFIANDVPPAQVDIKYLETLLKLICFFTECQKAWPAEGGRDEAHLRLAGALARLPEHQYSTELLQNFQQQLCDNTFDNEVLNRTEKIRYQRQQLQKGEKVFGISELRRHLGSELEAYNLLFEQKEEELQEEELFLSDPQEYPLIDAGMDDLIEYPPVDYLMNPILNSRSFNQTYGWYESGKTVFGLSLAMHMCSGHDFLGWTCDKTIPTFYLESELPGAIIREIKDTVKLGMLDRNITFDHQNHFGLNQDNLIDAGFKYGFSAIAVAKAHGKDAAKDYGRRGREMIENQLHKIEKQTGKKPFYFLDNMTKLSTIDENKAQDWTPFLNWGTDLKHKGFSGMFVHHANKNKEGKGSSGSSAIGRLLDTSIQLTKLEGDYRFPMKGKKNLQSSIEFDKSRGFGGSEWAKKRIITMSEQGEWKHYPYLKQISFVILGLANQGYTQEQIRTMAKNKEVRDHNNVDYSSSHVDRLYKQLVTLGLIKKNRATNCWNCKQPISTDADGSCPKCITGIPCSNCGECYCENPKRKK